MSSTSPIPGYAKIEVFDYVPPFQMSDTPNPYGLDFQRLLDLEGVQAKIFMRDGASANHQTGDILIVFHNQDGTIQTEIADYWAKGLSLSNPSPTVNAVDINPDGFPFLGNNYVIVRPCF